MFDHKNVELSQLPQSYGCFKLEGTNYVEIKLAFIELYNNLVIITTYNCRLSMRNLEGNKVSSHVTVIGILLFIANLK